MLDADEVEALAKFLRGAAQTLRDGTFEQEVRERIERENAEEADGID